MNKAICHWWIHVSWTILYYYRSSVRNWKLQARCIAYYFRVCRACQAGRTATVGWRTGESRWMCVALSVVFLCCEDLRLSTLFLRRAAQATKLRKSLYVVGSSFVENLIWMTSLRRICIVGRIFLLSLIHKTQKQNDEKINIIVNALLHVLIQWHLLLTY